MRTQGPADGPTPLTRGPDTRAGPTLNRTPAPSTPRSRSAGRRLRVRSAARVSRADLRASLHSSHVTVISCGSSCSMDAYSATDTPSSVTIRRQGGNSFGEVGIDGVARRHAQMDPRVFDRDHVLHSAFSDLRQVNRNRPLGSSFSRRLGVAFAGDAPTRDAHDFSRCQRHSTFLVCRLPTMVLAE